MTSRIEEELIARANPDAGPKAAYLIGGSMAYLAAVQVNTSRATLQQIAARVLA